MKEMNEGQNEAKYAWESNADYWDKKIGNDANEFHLRVIRPKTEELLEIRHSDRILDLACGNGNFSRRMTVLGASVTACDFSETLISHAIRRSNEIGLQIDYRVCDLTDKQEMRRLVKGVPYDKAVCNMAMMDISDITPLFEGVYQLLSDEGRFVLSTHHPCFTAPEQVYLSEKMHKGEAIAGQPVLQPYYHRSIQNLLNTAFHAGFVMDACYETAFEPDAEYPSVMIVRLRKQIFNEKISQTERISR